LGHSWISGHIVEGTTQRQPVRVHVAVGLLVMHMNLEQRHQYSHNGHADSGMAKSFDQDAGKATH